MESQPYTRPPRQRKYFWSYVGHALQGFVAGLFMPWFWVPYLYVAYQQSEYTAYYNRNKDGGFTAADTPSRDISDFKIGYTAGSTLSTIIWVCVIYYLTK